MALSRLALGTHPLGGLGRLPMSSGSDLSRSSCTSHDGEFRYLEEWSVRIYEELAVPLIDQQLTDTFGIIRII